MAAPPRANSRWLFGPGPDLLLGCGALYAIVFALLAFAGPSMRQLLPIGLLPLLALVTGTPHYGATLLRVYERRDDRRAYTLFSVHATALVWTAFVAGLYQPTFGSLLVTLYLTWSPWHYTGQNYGIAVMFLRRRGVRLTSTAKRHLYASFILCFALTVLAVHGASSPSATYAPATIEETIFHFVSLGIPHAVASPLLHVTLAAYLYATAATIVLLRREASFRELLPTLALVASQALWFAIPVLARAAQVLQWVEPLSLRHATYAFLWIAYAHSVQYLWVTTYYARTSGAATSRSGYFAKTLFAGAAIWGVPALLFAPGTLGRVPYESGLLLLVGAAVNIHHFILDGAIWKLRDGRIAKILIRSGGGEPEAAPRSSARIAWRPATVYSVGALCAVISLIGTLEFEFGVKRAGRAKDVARLQQASQRLAWLGRVDPRVHRQLGLLTANQGDPDGALRELEKSLALNESSRTWASIGYVHATANQPEQAIAAYEKALALDPNYVVALQGAGVVWLRLGEHERALEALRRAFALDPENPDVRTGLRRAKRAAKRAGAR